VSRHVISWDLTTAYDIRAIYVTHNATIVCVVKSLITWRDHMRAHVQILRVSSRCLFNLVAHWMWNKDNLIPESLFLKRNVYEKLGKYSIINVHYSISLIFCIYFFSRIGAQELFGWEFERALRRVRIFIRMLSRIICHPCLTFGKQEMILGWHSNGNLNIALEREDISRAKSW